MICKRSKVDYLFGKTLVLTGEAKKDSELIYGVPAELKDIPTPELKPGADGDGNYTEIVIPASFPPGSIMVLTTQMEGMPAHFEETCKSGADEAMAKLDLVDLNVVLYRADGEERDITQGEDGTYSIPNHEQLTYCGLEGWMPPLQHIMEHNDLGHALCAHLREGTWAMDYCVKRLDGELSASQSSSADKC